MHFRCLAPAATVIAACFLLAACQSAPKPEVEPASASAPTADIPIAPPEKWVRTELYFGLAPAEAEGLGLAAAEGTWRTFLDEEVTPRFPDGLTVLDAYGQWREDGAAEVERIRSRVLVIVHPDTPAKRAGIEALCTAFKERTGEKSVLVVETPIREPRF
jgi:hypothetical protein